ncbi:MAG: pilin [Planctomycetes bacterium]|jgi:uncharacterized membrane protein|nr:pilin [Planctomycetota bacterium]
MKLVFKKILFLLLLTLILISPSLVFAQFSSRVMTSKLDAVAQQSGYSASTDETTLVTTLGSIVNILLSLLGIIFVALTIYAGFNWMTAQGNEEKVKESKATLRTAVIGLVITLSSFAIWKFIESRL